MKDQTLDEYVQDGSNRYIEDGDVEVKEEYVEEKEEHIEEAIDSVESQECRYCRLKGSSEKFTLHPGALYLYYDKNEKLKAKADIEHSYRCERGLKDNIVFLYSWLSKLRSVGFNVVGVAKAFDDTLYAYVKGDFKKGRIYITIIDELYNFEEFAWDMMPVDEKTVMEAINEALESKDEDNGAEKTDLKNEDCMEEASMRSVEAGECRYCSLMDEGRYKLHPGALNLYYKDERLKAIADLDHVYDKCREGLKENIRFLYRMMRDLKSKGFDAVVVGKAFDDDLYAWVKRGESGKKLDYEGFSILLSRFIATLDEFEKMNWYMEKVDDDVVLEAVGVEHPRHSLEDGGR